MTTFRLLPALALALAAVPLLTGLTPPLWTPARIAAEDLGPAFRGTHPKVLGMDGAYSLPIGNRKSLWIFGDTLLGSWQPAGRRLITGFPPNTAAMVEDDNWQVGFPRAKFLKSATADPTPVLQAPGQSEKRRLWPMDAVNENGKFWMYYVEIEPFGKGPLDFKVTGTGAAEGLGKPPTRFVKKPAIWGEGAPSFGASAMIHGGFLYLYAAGDKTYLARRPVGKTEVSAYRYYGEKGQWVKDWKAAAALPGSGPEMSVRWNPYLKSFVMFFVPPFGKTVEARFAPAPWGPWSAAQHVAACQPAEVPGAMFYGAKQHVELDAEGGRKVVVTYNTNAPEAALLDHPGVYWPRILQVTFTR
jgi:hypothetical protein